MTINVARPHIPDRKNLQSYLDTVLFLGERSDKPLIFMWFQTLGLPGQSTVRDQLADDRFRIFNEIL
jgi:hypothetical protein